MTASAITLDVFQAFDVHRNFTLEISFYLKGFNNFSDLIFVCRRYFLSFGIKTYACFIEYFLRARTPDAIDGTESDF